MLTSIFVDIMFNTKSDSKNYVVYYCATKSETNKFMGYCKISTRLENKLVQYCRTCKKTMHSIVLSNCNIRPDKRTNSDNEKPKTNVLFYTILYYSYE